MMCVIGVRTSHLFFPLPQPVCRTVKPQLVIFITATCQHSPIGLHQEAAITAGMDTADPMLAAGVHLLWGGKVILGSLTQST